MRLACAGILSWAVWGAQAADFDPRLFDYRRPARLVVEETTPTREQLHRLLRPPQLATNAAAPQATGPAQPATVGSLNIIRLRFTDATGETVPALLCTPRSGRPPFPVVIAVHGMLNHKAQVCFQVAPALAARGYAVLAADMPSHGERSGHPPDLANFRAWSQSFPLFRRAIIDVRQLIDLAAQRPEIDPQKTPVLVGYSMGSWISCATAAADARVKRLVLMVAGVGEQPFVPGSDPEAVAADPLAALRRVAGRPILLLNGSNDAIVPAASARRLFEACPEPKRQTWYKAGHFLPAQAFEDAAQWIVAQGQTPTKR